MAKKIVVTYVKSSIKCPERQKRVLESLGFKKLNSVVEHEATPEILGMIRKVSHLVKCETL